MSASTRVLRTAAAFALAVAAWGLLYYRIKNSVRVDLSRFERSVFSPSGEDGVLEKMFDVVKPKNRYLLELGAGDGINGSSSRYLIDQRLWRGLLIESDDILFSRLRANYASSDRVRTMRADIDPGDVEILLEKSGVPRDLDLLIVSLKSNDWYVWRAIVDFRPRVVQIQYNAAFAPPQTMVIEYHPLNHWDRMFYFGASIQSLFNLGRRKGYELVYANQAGTNLFFVEKSYFKRFGIADNSPLRVYRRCRDLPVILPSLIWEHLELDGAPQARYGRELVVEDVRVPRRYVFDQF